MQGTSYRTDKNEQSSRSAEDLGQVQAGRKNAPTSIRTAGDGVRQEASSESTWWQPKCAVKSDFSKDCVVNPGRPRNQRSFPIILEDSWIHKEHSCRGRESSALNVYDFLPSGIMGEGLTILIYYQLFLLPN